MLPGYATEQATQLHSEKFADITYNPMGTTGLWVSAAGFGGYRVIDGVRRHYEAMQYALTRGINLLDTSTNYGDGGSEELVGKVLAASVADGQCRREEVVVVSKIGYLQGENYRRSQQRQKQGSQWPELVRVADGLAHCIHPEFLKDQLSRSLNRLGLETLDVLLLHNPEYYLEWAVQHGMDLKAAQAEYYRRLDYAFQYLEKEVQLGRIRHYGVSSNTFPVPMADPAFTSLSRIFKTAGGPAKRPHLKVIQMPLNLFERGAVLEMHPPRQRSVLDEARDLQLGVLINRPLNAFSDNRLVRLASVSLVRRQSDDEVIAAIRAVTLSEQKLWVNLMQHIDLPSGLRIRIKEQLGVGDSLKHYWRNFGSYEQWRQTFARVFWPRVQGVFDFLKSHARKIEDLDPWIAAHEKTLTAALKAVGSRYQEKAARQAQQITDALDRSDSDWASADSLSQKALRAVRSTLGVSCVLVGMRQKAYVDDVLAELARPISCSKRTEAWQRLQNQMETSRS